MTSLHMRPRYTPAARKAVRREIKRMLLEGMKYRQITEALINAGIKRPDGAPVNEKFVSNQVFRIKHGRRRKVRKNKQDSSAHMDLPLFSNNPPIQKPAIDLTIIDQILSNKALSDRQQVAMLRAFRENQS